jgi:hypothetical protein
MKKILLLFALPLLSYGSVFFAWGLEGEIGLSRSLGGFDARQVQTIQAPVPSISINGILGKGSSEEIQRSLGNEISSAESVLKALGLFVHTPRNASRYDSKANVSMDLGYAEYHVTGPCIRGVDPNHPVQKDDKNRFWNALKLNGSQKIIFNQNKDEYNKYGNAYKTILIVTGFDHKGERLNRKYEAKDLRNMDTFSEFTHVKSIHMTLRVGHSPGPIPGGNRKLQKGLFAQDVENILENINNLGLSVNVENTYKEYADQNGVYTHIPHITLLMARHQDKTMVMDSSSFGSIIQLFRNLNTKFAQEYSRRKPLEIKFRHFKSSYKKG